MRSDLGDETQVLVDKSSRNVQALLERTPRRLIENQPSLREHASRAASTDVKRILRLFIE